MITIRVEDLTALRPNLDAAKAAKMIQGAVARAAQVAPCLLADSFAGEDVARAIILDALVRRVDGGGGAVTQSQQTAGPFSHTQTVDSRSALNLFTAQERADLAALCGRRQRAYTINTAPSAAPTDPLHGVRVNGPVGCGPGER